MQRAFLSIASVCHFRFFAKLVKPHASGERTLYEVVDFIFLCGGMLANHLIITPSRSYCTAKFTDILCLRLTLKGNRLSLNAPSALSNAMKGKKSLGAIRKNRIQISDTSKTSQILN